MLWFAIASLTPAVCLAAASVLGAPWGLVAIASITLVVFGFDRFVPRLSQDTRGAGKWLCWAQAAAHFALWGLGIWALGQPGLLTPVDKALLVVGLGLYFGQVSNSNAHELIHQSGRGARRLGMLIYGSLLFAHHVSAHLRVHHVHAATALDPNTARLGEGFWRFVLRAWPQEYRAGKAAEDIARSRAQSEKPWHPYAIYALVSAGFTGAALWLGGGAGLLCFLLIAAYAQVQLYLSDYVQHYGLERAVSTAGKPVPMGPAHSWNAPHWYSSAMMLNAPRHSDHHLHPARAFPELRIDPEQMPVLPRSLPVMGALALIPPLWRRVMDKRVLRWRETAQSTANPPA